MIPEYTTIPMPYPHAPKDAPPIILTVQSNIPAHELNRLPFNLTEANAQCAAFAPYITGWNLPTAPPSVAGADAFDDLSVEFVGKVFAEIYRISVARSWEEVNQQLQRDWDGLTPSA